MSSSPISLPPSSPLDGRHEILHAASATANNPGNNSDEFSEELRQPKLALVTGASGFAGRHLVSLLLAETAWRVAGVGRRAANSPKADRWHSLAADLGEPGEALRVLAEVKPDYIFLLAAATPPASDDEMLRVNVLGTAQLMEAAASVSPHAQILSVGSDAEYGLQDAGHVPTDESAPLRPIGMYGRSKVLQEGIARLYGQISRLKVVCVRPFNYFGPGQSEGFVIPALARQIALAELGLAPNVVEVGRTDTARDLTDVRDVVCAFILALTRSQNREIYNIGSGTSRRIQDIAEILAARARVPITFRSNTARTRQGDVIVTQCDDSRFRKLTGWVPTIPFEQTLEDVLNDWRARVAAQKPKTLTATAESEEQ